MGLLDDIVREAASLAIGLIIDTPATLVRTPEPTLDKETGERFTHDPVPYSIKITPPEPRRVQIDGGKIERRLKTFAAALDLPITPNSKTDVLIIDGIEHGIVSVDETSGGDEPALWEFSLRV